MLLIKYESIVFTGFVSLINNLLKNGKMYTEISYFLLTEADYSKVPLTH